MPTVRSHGVNMPRTNPAQYEQVINGRAACFPLRSKSFVSISRAKTADKAIRIIPLVSVNEKRNLAVFDELFLGKLQLNLASSRHNSLLLTATLLAVK